MDLQHLGSEPNIELTNKEKITNLHLNTNSNTRNGSTNDYVEQGENEVMAMTYSS